MNRPAGPPLETPPGKPKRLLDFASVGWVLVLALIVGALVVWRVIGPHVTGDVPPARGDGRDVATYGFDLSTCLVPREQLVASVPVDFMPALNAPKLLSAAEVESYNRDLRERRHIKFLVPGDRVIGVEINGEARAYPLNVLNWHEVVNDELGGVPIAVTYNPLCDSAVVFDRRVDGETRHFGVSGLLYNSNLLMYDRQSDHSGESLWSQLQFRAIAGPAAAAGARLIVLPMQLTDWEHWLALHPDSSVLVGDESRLDRYNGSPYSSYYQSGKLRFPAMPPPPAGGLALFERVLALQGEDGWTALPYSEIESHLDSGGAWRKGALTLRLLPVEPGREQPCAWAQWDLPQQYASVSCLWFAWYALHPETPPPPRQ